MPNKSKDNENITKTMQDKSGIYQDRTDGKLPQGRVAQHYQAMDAKMEQSTNPFAEKLRKSQEAEAAARAAEKKKNKESDTWYNDTANDGNMVSRALRKAESYLPGPIGS